MKILSKKIVCEEGGRPVETRMDYDEFLRVKAEVEETDPLENYRRMMTFAGSVDFGGEDGLEYQRRLRAEWD